MIYLSQLPLVAPPCHVVHKIVTTDNSLINAHTVLMRMRCNRHNRHVVLSIDNLGDNISVNIVRLANNPTLHW